MTKTRSIDFSKLGLRDALDLATIIEEEAKERYQELADQMELHHNAAAAHFFRFMHDVEVIHERKLFERRTALFGKEPRTVDRGMIFDIEAPDYDSVRATMTPRQALHTALAAEVKAFEFFEASLPSVTDADVRELFTELRDEELEHQGLVQKQITALAPDDAITTEDMGDDPVAQ